MAELHTYYVTGMRTRRVSFRGRWQQLRTRLRCWRQGHDWTPWTIDDMDGPGEHIEGGGFMPYCSRDSRPGEFGIRSCRNSCGNVESRWPAHTAPKGARHGKLVAMERVVDLTVYYREPASADFINISIKRGPLK